MKYMKYKVYTEDPNNPRKDMKVASCVYRSDADTVCNQYAFAYIKFGEKIIFKKGAPS